MEFFADYDSVAKVSPGDVIKITKKFAPLRKCPKCREPGGLIYCPKCHSPRK